jgi:hypothetical protein
MVLDQNSHDQEVVGSNPAFYWMDLREASYYRIKVAKWGTPKKAYLYLKTVSNVSDIFTNSSFHKLGNKTDLPRLKPRNYFEKKLRSFKQVTKYFETSILHQDVVKKVSFIIHLFQWFFYYKYPKKAKLKCSAITLEQRKMI